MKYEILIDGARHSVEFSKPQGESSRVLALIDGRSLEADVARISHDTYSILLGGRSLEVNVEEAANTLSLRIGQREFQVEIIDPRSWRRGRGAGAELEGRQQAIAPMPGKIVSILVSAGQKVEVGQGLLVIEAMKMQNEIRSPKSGAVERLLVKAGQTVKAGEVVAIIE